MMISMEKDTTLKDQIVDALNGRFDSFEGKVMTVMDGQLRTFKVELKEEIVGEIRIEMDKKFRAQGLLLEDMRDDIDTLVDGQEILHERIDRLQSTVSSIDEKVERLDVRLRSVEIL